MPVINVPANTDIILTPRTVGKPVGPTVKATYTLSDISNDPAIPLIPASGGFLLPGKPSGATTIVEVDTIVAFNGADTADVTLTANPAIGNQTTAVCTIAKADEGVIVPGAVTINHV